MSNKRYMSSTQEKIEQQLQLVIKLKEESIVARNTLQRLEAINEMLARNSSELARANKVLPSS